MVWIQDRGKYFIMRSHETRIMILCTCLKKNVSIEKSVYSQPSMACTVDTLLKTVGECQCFMPKNTRWNSFSYLDAEMFYHEEEMFLDRSAPFSGISLVLLEILEGPKPEEEVPLCWEPSWKLSWSYLHDFNWFYRMRIPIFNRNLFVFNIFHKINVINFYLRWFSFSILGKKEVWPSWLEHLLWI